MGNYCSSTKKDKDTASEKSEESPSYQLSSKLKKNNDSKEAPLADPEPTSDISHQNTSFTLGSNNGSVNRPEPLTDISKPQLKALQSIQLDSGSNSPLTLQPPCELPSVTQLLPPNLQPLNGQPSKNRRTENDKKIVLYILAADDGHKVEKSVLHSLYDHFHDICACRGFEIHISDVHETTDNNFLDVSCWVDSPLEAKGGHHLAATSLAEISRHSNLTYVIPILFLGSSLGSPLLPLTIESQDFVTVLSTANNTSHQELLQKWYILDNKAQPPCYRLRTVDIPANGEASKELDTLLTILVEIFTKELQDLYLTTVVEQEINNTVLISQELSKRCIWIQTGALPSKVLESGTSLEVEMNRRLNNIHVELKNQLPEKNLIRIPPTIQLQNDQIAAIFDSLISPSIESIIDEHNSKYQIPYCTFGLQRSLLEEIEAVSQHSKALGQNCAYFEIMDKIQNYVTTSSSEPLIIFGKSGSGKSVLSAKVAQYIHKWLPESSFILRYTNLTPLSSDIVSILSSIAEQVSYLTKAVPCFGPHEINFYAETIKNCIDCTKHQLVILIDSIDEAQNLDNLNWMPCKLIENVKLILTVTSTATSIDQCNEEDFILQNLKDKISKANFIHLSPFSSEQWKGVLSSGGGDFYATNGALHLPETWISSTEKIPLQAKIFWWLAWLGEFNLKDFSLANICDKVFETLESKFDNGVTKYLIALIAASRDGLMETEIIKLLTESGLVKGSPQRVWIQFCWVMGPMLLHTTLIKLIDKKLKTIAKNRYEADIKRAHNILHEFYKKQENIVQDKKRKHKCYNKKKFIELPYHAFKIDSQSFATSPYTTDISWIYYKLNAVGCVHIFNDINLLDKNQRAEVHITVLKKFLTEHIRPLNYDTSQFYSLFPAFLDQTIETDSSLSSNSFIQQWLEHLKSIPIPYLVKLSKDNEIIQEDDKNICYDVITNLCGNGYFVASLSTNREEICVWDVQNCQKIRILTGIPQPTALCPAGDYGAAVLCRREIKVIDLNEGIFKVTLKGVMNQKMPYFGLHDSQHLVCLSRNRMYVNLMNLESGDCVTTFKAGEDRFLNSLLVSGDGRMLVCGDETQKPFPLLVWHLTQRKLLYDLRIPHHDFITSLSAITHEGSYVSVVAKELNEPTPNFIVVYDLQSGTLFKKWKPNCNTVSLAISQTNTCVIAGLEDSRIFIWDLVTGNCKYTLIGHNAPVTLLKLDPEGKVLLSADKEGRDLSVRMWELDTGKALAVHTPSNKITTCEILPEGKFIVLALAKHANLVILELKNTPFERKVENGLHYGNQENEGKTFNLQ